MPDRTVLLSEYLAGPPLIEQCVANCSEEELEQRETPGEWSVRQIIHHVADVEVGDAMRMRLMVAHESPLIVAYDEELFASRLYYDPTDCHIVGDLHKPSRIEWRDCRTTPRSRLVSDRSPRGARPLHRRDTGMQKH